MSTKRGRTLGLSRHPQATGWRWAHYSESSASARKALSGVLRSRLWKKGAYNTRLTTRLSEFLGVPPSWLLLTNSCTTALSVAFKFCEIDRWKFPLMTYAATAAWPLDQGKPVEFVDVDEDGWPVEPVTCGVELWGRPFPGERPPVLDAAHAFALPHHAQWADAGTAICYSFGPMKEVPCFSGGAMIWKELEDPAVREQVEAWIHYGQAHRVPTGEGGINGYMNDAAAAVILHHLRDHLKRKARRLFLLKIYENFLGDYMATRPGTAHGSMAVVRFPNQGWLKRSRYRLTNMEVRYAHHYPIDHVQFGDTHAHDLSKRILTVPCHTKMQKQHAIRISRAILAG